MSFWPGPCKNNTPQCMVLSAPGTIADPRTSQAINILKYGVPNWNNWVVKDRTTEYSDITGFPESGYPFDFYVVLKKIFYGSNILVMAL